jgi:hypothetical protein
MQPLRPPEGVLTDGVVSLRVPPAGDADTFVGYAAGQDGGLGEAWLPLLYARRVGVPVTTDPSAPLQGRG